MKVIINNNYEINNVDSFREHYYNGVKVLTISISDYDIIRSFDIETFNTELTSNINFPIQVLKNDKEIFSSGEDVYNVLNINRIFLEANSSNAKTSIYVDFIKGAQ